jgi:hypothetical protein
VARVAHERARVHRQIPRGARVARLRRASGAARWRALVTHTTARPCPTRCLCFKPLHVSHSTAAQSGGLVGPGRPHLRVDACPQHGSVVHEIAARDAEVYAAAHEDARAWQPAARRERSCRTQGKATQRFSLLCAGLGSHAGSSRDAVPGWVRKSRCLRGGGLELWAHQMKYWYCYW